MKDDDIIVHSTLEVGEDYFIYDQWKRKYHFKIAEFRIPVGRAFEEIEVRSDNHPGYRFNQAFDYDINTNAAKQIFAEIIKKRLNQRHLMKSGTDYEIGNRNILRGRIEWNDDFSDTKFDKIFVIDGKRITIEAFGKLVEPFEGFDFIFKIKDSYDNKE